MGGGGWGGGDFWHTWEGGVLIASKAFLTQKLRFFEMDVILIIKYWRPPHAPPHNVTCEI